MYLFETGHTRKTISALAITFMWLVFIQAGILHAVDSVRVAPVNVKPGASSIYRIHFSLDRAIEPQAIIQVTFPQAFDLSGVLIAGSKTINGGFQVSVNQSTVTIRRSGLGRLIPAKEAVDLRFANVKNPATASDSYNIRVRIQDANKAVFVDKTETIKIQEQN